VKRSTGCNTDRGGVGGPRRRVFFGSRGNRVEPQTNTAGSRARAGGRNPRPPKTKSPGSDDAGGRHPRLRHTLPNSGAAEQPIKSPPYFMTPPIRPPDRCGIWAIDRSLSTRTGFRARRQQMLASLRRKYGFCAYTSGISSGGRLKGTPDEEDLTRSARLRGRDDPLSGRLDPDLSPE